ncbi:trypsin-like serine protease [Allokutzneria oryzae]|uniref:Trypsin-like serine protease n=1 Tax=Allokutzneria oryzae TaxID=1378989 RepID=A0ABV6A265_9PSEU
MAKALLPCLLMIAATAVVVPALGGDKEFVASLRSAETGTYLCDATIVSPEWLVTAARCLESRGPAELTVRISPRRGEGLSATVGVAERITHPDYTPSTPPRADVGLVRLSIPVSMSSTARPAPDVSAHRDWIAHHLNKES